MRNELKEVISAIENGQKTEDSRGVVYKQEFGEAFLNKLKDVLKKEEQYICPKTKNFCDDEMCDSAKNCNISSEIKENKEPSFDEISNQFHQIAKDYKHPFEGDEMKSCKSENESSH